MRSASRKPLDKRLHALLFLIAVFQGHLLDRNLGTTPLPPPYPDGSVICASGMIHIIINLMVSLTNTFGIDIKMVIHFAKVTFSKNFIDII